MTAIQKPKPSLLQRATLQTQANRFAFLKQTTNRKLIAAIVNK